MQIKKVLVIMMIILIVVLLKNFVFYNKYKMPKNASISVKNDKIDVYDEKNLYDLIQNTNTDIITENTNLDCSIIGEHTYTIEYKYKLKKYLYDVKYDVIDETAPIFINAPSTKTFYVNESTENDLTKKVSYADNYDENPKLKIDGIVDFNQVGSYKIKYIVTDQSGNETTKDTTVNIKERVTKPKDDTNNDDTDEEENYISLEDQITDYKTNETMIGIDVSKWQGDIDFQKVKDSGVEFVILRLGVMKDKDTPMALDSNFNKNYKNAKSAGLKVGVYLYSESTTVQSAIENAEFAIENLKNDTLDFPICYDWESWSYFNELGINLHRLNEMYDAFSNKLKEAGYETMLYASENYLNNTWITLKDYPIWVAKYSSKTPSVSGKDYILWQNTSVGRVDGIEGDVDFDIYYKNK